MILTNVILPTFIDMLFNEWKVNVYINDKILSLVLQWGYGDSMAEKTYTWYDSNLVPITHYFLSVSGSLNCYLIFYKSCYMLKQPNSCLGGTRTIQRWINVVEKLPNKRFP